MFRKLFFAGTKRGIFLQQFMFRMGPMPIRKRGSLRKTGFRSSFPFPASVNEHKDLFP